MTTKPIQMKACSIHELIEDLRQYYNQNNILIDSFVEDHLFGSQFYQILVEGSFAGAFSIFKGGLLTHFHVTEPFRHLSEVIFNQVKRFEMVTSAFVPTSDELLLTHCLDNFARMEKQAYFSTYRSKPLTQGLKKDLQAALITKTDDLSLLDRALDFFDEETKEKILKEEAHFKVLEMFDQGAWVGYGVIEYGRIRTDIASIGMYVTPEKRQQGYAANILKALQIMVELEGFEAHSGCWYYNHNSRKSMESAGAYMTSRLMKFFF